MFVGRDRKPARLIFGRCCQMMFFFSLGVILFLNVEGILRVFAVVCQRRWVFWNTNFMKQTFSFKYFHFDFWPSKKLSRYLRKFWHLIKILVVSWNFFQKNLPQQTSRPKSWTTGPPEAAQLVARVRAGSVLHELQRDLKELEVHVDLKGHSWYLVFFLVGDSQRKTGGMNQLFF